MSYKKYRTLIIFKTINEQKTKTDEVISKFYFS